jgi:cysteinyl-tRNA synthetase
MALATSFADVSSPLTETPAVQDVQQLRSSLQLYNTMNRCKEPFRTRPKCPNDVAMYVCGVTVYDYSHIGEAGLCHAAVGMVMCFAALQYGIHRLQNH